MLGVLKVQISPALSYLVGSGLHSQNNFQRKDLQPKPSTALHDPRSIYVSSLAHIPFKKYPADLKRIYENVFHPSVISVF